VESAGSCWRSDGHDREGLATRTAFELPQRILWDKLDDFVLVRTLEIRTAFG